MAGTDIIREFFVSLGYKVDREGERKFKQGVEGVTKTVAKLGEELALVAAAVGAATAVVASRFEDLYYASQRIGASVQNIQAFRFAVGQMGGDSKAALGSLEALASFMRSSPGGERFVQSLGVQTRETNGEMRDTTRILGDLGAKFRAMPYYAAKVRANALGIDENTMQALIRGDLQRGLDSYGRIAKRVGMDQQAAAQASHDFMNRVRELGTYLALLGERFTLLVQGPINRLMDAFWNADKATHGLSTAVIGLMAVLLPLAALVGPEAALIAGLGAAILTLWDDFQTWKEGGTSLIDWGAWSKQIDDAMAGLKDIGSAFGELGDALNDLGINWKAVGDIMGGIARGVIVYIVTEMHALAESIRLIASLLKGDFSGAWQHAGNVMKLHMQSFGDAAKAALTPPDRGGPTAQERQRALGRTAATSGGGDLTRQAMLYFQQVGWSASQAAGIVANLQRESGLNAGAQGDHGAAYGLAQWHRDRQQEFARRFGHGIQGSSYADQLAFVQYELTEGRYRGVGNRLRGTTGDADAARLVSGSYEAPADRMGEMARRAAIAANVANQARLGGYYGSGANDNGGGGGQGVVISQKTDIHVNGAGDPQSVANAAAASQGRVNSDLVRNAQTALK